MNITFHGAAQSVSGCCFPVEALGSRFLIDCGMAQGGREADEHLATLLHERLHFPVQVPQLAQVFEF
ncbi:hypothetical protein DJFAAGMI_00923 [Comamonas sp. PE63]|uniref:MBL fold metallo-hydrolase n=1 Tax=Comamonas brasiliensis TaxID=1812482 RepID=A0ABS5LNX8_9BURK|nr:hypothetical protein [Comamonas sp. PE63]MBS3018192.1 hypothetical protein [Comamonas sp. PE63]